MKFEAFKTLIDEFAGGEKSRTLFVLEWRREQIIQRMDKLMDRALELMSGK